MSWEVEQDSSDLPAIRGQLRKGVTGQLISFRAEPTVLRQIEEIVASRIDVRFKTTSDCIRDAIVDWVEKFVENNDVQDTLLKNEFLRVRNQDKLFQLAERDEQDEYFLEILEARLKKAKQDNHEYKFIELKEIAIERVIASYDEKYKDRIFKLLREYQIGD